MKFLERMKIWGRKTSEKVLKVDETDKAESLKTDLTKQFGEIKNAYNEARAERSANLKLEERYKKTIEMADMKFKQLAAEGNKQNARLVFDKKQAAEISLASLKATIDVQNKAIENLERQKDICEKNLSKINNQISAIKAKERYATNVEKYTSILEKANVNGTNIDEIEYNVDVKFNTAEFKLDDMATAQAADALLEDSVGDIDFESAFNEAIGATEITEAPEVKTVTTEDDIII